MIKSKWPVVHLGDIAEFRNGMNYNKDNFGKGLKVINVKDFQDRLIVDFHDLDEINPDGIVRDECYIRNGDILFVRSNGNRELIGRSMLVENVPEPISHSAFSIKTRFTASDVFPRYYAYLFRTSLIRSELSNRGGGTNISNLNQDILTSLEVPKPPLPIQRKIAGILSAYDDLIENNTRRITILEEMAQSIYREWFVHFRFPGHERIKLADSPLGKIPKGWEVKTLADVTSYINRGVSPKYDISVPSVVINQKCIRENWIDISKARTHRTSVPLDKQLAFGDILVNSTGRGTLGRVAQVYSIVDDWTVDSHVTIVRPNDIKTVDYLGFVVRHLQQHFDHLGTGSTGQTELPRSVIGGTQILFPHITIQEQFSFLVSNQRTECEVLRRKNRNLRVTRDLLLPKLISGELDVEELDIDTGERPLAVVEKLPVIVSTVMPSSAESKRKEGTPYKDDAAVLCVLVDELLKSNRPTTEFFVQKHAFALKHLRRLSINSPFVAQKAGPWSQELRRKALHAAEGNGWLIFNEQTHTVYAGRNLAAGLDHAQTVLGNRFGEVATLVQDLVKFGNSGLERWMTIYKVVCDLKENGKAVTLTSIQKGIDDWPGKRKKDDFSVESVNDTVQKMVRRGWFSLG